MPQRIDALTGQPITPVSTQNDTYKVRDSFEFLDATKWDVVTDTGDTVTTGGNTAGSGYLKISKSLDQEGTETILTSKFIVQAPVRIGLGMSLSQRLAHQRFSFSLVGVDAAGNVVNEIPVDPVLSISTITQSTTTLTVTTSVNHNYVPGDRVHIYGVTADSRFNYGEVYVYQVLAPNQFTVTATPSATIASVTAGPYSNSGYVQRVDPLLGADNEFAVVWEGTSSSNAKLVSRADKSAIYNSGDASLGSGHTNANIANGNAFADGFNPQYMYDLRYKSEGVVVRTFPMDSTGLYGGMMRRSQVVPDIVAGYKIRIRARNNKGMTKPVANIITAVKSGSTTATITTDVAHGLTTGDQIVLYGMRDQTNFANQTSQVAVASVINSTQFTVVFGASATATTQGGIVYRVNGSMLAAPSGQSVQSISSSGGLMTVVGNTTWGGFSVGETIELRGLVDASNVHYTQYEGVYQVANISTTTLTLYNTGKADFATINVGGAVAKRTDLRLHFFRAVDYNRQTVEIDGSIGSYSDGQEALPVGIVNQPNVSSLPNANATQNTESTTALGANANFTGSSRDTSVPAGFNRMRATVMAVAGMGHGHIAFEQSVDNVTFRETGRYPVPSDGTYYTFDFPITMRYVRLRFYNGAVAQTSFFFASSQIRIDGPIDFNLSPTYTHSTTALAASAQFTGVSLNLGTMNPYNKHRAYVYTDQPGTLYLEQSRDNVNWRTTASYAVGAAGTFMLEDLLAYQYCRVRYVNGATAETALEIVSTLLSF